MDDWEEIFNAIPDMIVILDPQQRIVRCNKAMAQYLGVSTEDLLGDICYKNLHEAQKPPHNCPFVYMMADGIEHSEEVYLEQIGKEFQVSVSPIFNPGGQVKGCVHVVRDITRRKQAEQALRESENRFRTLFETMAKGVIYHDRNGKIIDANPAAQRILGLTLEQMQQSQPSYNPSWRTIHQDGSDFPQETHPAMQSLKTGKEVPDVIMGVINPNHQTASWLLVSAIPQFHPGEDKPFQVFTTFQDITEMKKTQDELQKSQQELRTQLEEIGDLQDILRQQAIRDPLTSIFNRRYMEETLLLEMAQADRQHSTIGIIMLDIDRFKQFNDTFGHQGGDLVLQDFGGVLTTHVREGDIACRYGGEEFVIIMPGADQDNTFHRAEQIRKEFDKMIAQRTDEMSFQITLSAGVVIYPIHARDRDGILNLADRALYQAKNQGRNKTVIYQNVS